MPIYAVQGDGRESPLRDRVVSVRGIVTGSFLGNADSEGDLGGFYLQEEETDGDAATSDGVFVFTRDVDADVQAGDRVAATGRVVEFFGETQLAAQEIEVIGRGSIAPVDITLPIELAVDTDGGRPVADLEAYEGMLVRIAEPLYVADLRELGRFGSLGLAARQPFEQYTNANSPDAAGYARHRDRVTRSTLRLDDGRRDENVSPPRYLFDAGRALRIGDEVGDVVANVRYSRGSGDAGIESYRLMPVTAPRFTASNPRPTAPAEFDGLRVMSLNTLNFFTTLDTGAPVCGPRRDAGCRGADSRREFERQRDKLVSAIRASDADIVGLMEVENGADEPLESLTRALNADAGDWAFVDTGAIGLDSIRVALLFRSDVVAPVGSFELLDSDVDRRFDSSKNRPSLAQTFRGLRSDWQLTVVVNHLKSKGSDCVDVGDPNRRDGQGNCNATRTAAARALAAWLDSAVFADSGGYQLIIGDLNAYEREDPLVALERGGFRLLGPSPGETSYSYVFDGQRGALDHALASADLAERVSAAFHWHVNADEPAELDYNLDRGRDPSWFDATTPFRSSDHDPVIIDLALDVE